MTPTAYLQRVERVLVRVEELGINWKRSRFARYRDVFEILASADVRVLRSLHGDGNQRLIYEAAAQCRQLEMASFVWDRLARQLLITKLRKVFKGRPLPPSGTEDDEPRNTLLELLSAAILDDYGFEVTITENDEDVVARKTGFPDLGIECKRPASLKGIQPNLSRLKKQVTRASCPLAVAIIGADRLAGLAGGLHKAADEAEIMQALASMTQHVIDFVRTSGRRPRCALAPKAPVGVVIMVGGAFLVEGGQVHSFARFQPFPTAGEGGVTEIVRTSMLASSGRLAAYNP